MFAISLRKPSLFEDSIFGGETPIDPGSGSGSSSTPPLDSGENTDAGGGTTEGQEQEQQTGPIVTPGGETPIDPTNPPPLDPGEGDPQTGPIVTPGGETPIDPTNPPPLDPGEGDPGDTAAWIHEVLGVALHLKLKQFDECQAALDKGNASVDRYKENPTEENKQQMIKDTQSAVNKCTGLA